MKNTKQMKVLYKVILVLALAVSVTSCFDKNRPNYQYMDNMYEPLGYEAYGSYDVFENGQEAKLPVEGTVSRGWMPYDYDNTNEGKEAAKASLTNPLPYTEENLANGKQMYTIYCAICHGDKGDGKGTLAQREKILGVPAYNDIGRAITEGSTYHVMYYGINTMGSYAAQTSEEERWQIVHHVMKLKDALDGKTERPTVDEDASNLQPSEADVSATVQTTEVTGNESREQE